ncbi:extracellular solute-binding protein [Eubacteriales bacterium mix99]
MKKIIAICLLLSVFMVSCRKENVDQCKVLSIHQQNTLSVMSWRQEDAPAMKNLIDDFERSHPGIKMEMECVSLPQYAQTIQVRLSSGTGVSDVIFLKPDLDFFLSLTNRKALLDLSECDFLDQYPKELSSVYAVNEKQYGIPYTANVITTICNKEVLNRFDLQMPRCWEETEKIFNFLKKSGVVPIVCGGEQTDDMDKSYLPIFLANAEQYRYQSARIFFYYVHTQQTGDILSNDMVQSFLECMKSLADSGYYPAENLNLSKTQATELFANGKAAFLLGDTASVSTIYSYNPDCEFEFSQLPMEFGSLTGYKSIGTVLGIGSDTPAREECKEFISYLSQPEVATAYGDAINQLVLVNGVTPQNEMCLKIKDLFDQKLSFDPAACVSNYESWYRKPFNDLVARVISGQPVKLALEYGKKAYAELIAVTKYIILP